MVDVIWCAGTDIVVIKGLSSRINVLVDIGIDRSCVIVVGHFTRIDIIIGINWCASTGVLINVGHGTGIDIIVVISHGARINIVVIKGLGARIDILVDVS